MSAAPSFSTFSIRLTVLSFIRLSGKSFTAAVLVLSVIKMVIMMFPRFDSNISFCTIVPLTVTLPDLSLSSFIGMSSDFLISLP